MKAIQLDRFGGPEVLQLTDIDPPAPGDGQTLVQVKACGVCFLDAIVRSGLRSKAKLPLTLGHEVAGVVTAVGPNVRTVAVGDRVASTYRVACGHCRYCRAGDGAVCGGGGARPQPDGHRRAHRRRLRRVHGAAVGFPREDSGRRRVRAGLGLRLRHRRGLQRGRQRCNGASGRDRPGDRRRRRAAIRCCSTAPTSGGLC